MSVPLTKLKGRMNACSKTDKLCWLLMFTLDLSFDICFGNEHLLRLVIIL